MAKKPSWAGTALVGEDIAYSMLDVTVERQTSSPAPVCGAVVVVAGACVKVRVYLEPASASRLSDVTAPRLIPAELFGQGCP